MQSLSSEKNNNDYTTVTVSKTNNIIETSINSLYFNNCDIVSFFENKCEVNHKSNEDTKKLILDIITQIQDGSLDNLLRSIVQNGQSYIKNEKNEVYSITTTDYQEIKENKTIIDFGVCENILKDAYNIDKREELILFTVERYIPGYKIPIIEYGLFSQNGKISLDLSLCKGINIQTYIPVDINENELYKYDPSDKFFNDRCHKYTTENGTDITLYDRQKDYNDNNMSLCESHCDYKGYDSINKRVICECEIKNIKNFLNNINKDKLLNQFKNIKKILNIDILKCYKLLFTLDGLITNIGSYIMDLIIVISIILSIYFCSKGFNQLDSQIKLLLPLKDNNKKVKNKEVKFEDINNNKKSILKSEKSAKNNSKNKLIKLKDNSSIIKDNINNISLISENSQKSYKTNKKSKIKNKNNLILKTEPLQKNKSKTILNNIIDKNNKLNKKIKDKKEIKSENKIKIEKNENQKLNDYEMNSLSYENALKSDNRDYLTFYFSLLKNKQILIFTFCMKSDYNSTTIKIMLFLFSFSLYFTINALFFTDSTMHQIYIDHGAYNIVYQLPQIIYSTIISTILNLLISYLSLTEKSIVKIRQMEKNIIIEKTYQFLNYYKIKLKIFFVFYFLFSGLFWFYISVFCAIYTNTQICLIKDTVISLGTSFAYQFFINLIPGLLRIPSLKAKDKDKEYIYKISQLLQLI